MIGRLARSCAACSNYRVPLVCEDLAAYGVSLVAPSADEYPSLVADIVDRLRSRPNGGPPQQDELGVLASEYEGGGSAVLLNRASRAIVSVAYIWHVRLADGRVVPQSYSPWTNASVLLPFQLDETFKNFHSYWHTIFPGSKRLVRLDGSILGDNTDVRSPEPSETWSGGLFQWGGAVKRKGSEALKLTLDGVFFEDGGFAGPNQLGSWEKTVFAAESHLEFGALARQAQRDGTAPTEFLDKVRTLTGQNERGHLPAPPPPNLPRLPAQLRENERA